MWLGGGVCMTGQHAWLGVCAWMGGVHTWLEGACVAGEACMAGEHAWLVEGHAWLGGMHGWGVYMAWGHAWHAPPGLILRDTVGQ